jgi:hypothetical protein
MKYPLFLSIISLFLFASCAPQTDIIFDVPKIVNKTQPEVIELIGEPDSSYNTFALGRAIPTHLYLSQSHRIEILYPNKKATEIIVNHPQPLPFSSEALPHFNVKPSIPPSDSVYNTVLTWSGLQDFKKVSIFAMQLDENGQPDKWQIFFRTE